MTPKSAKARHGALIRSISHNNSPPVKRINAFQLAFQQPARRFESMNRTEFDYDACLRNGATRLISLKFLESCANRDALGMEMLYTYLDAGLYECPNDFFSQALSRVNSNDLHTAIACRLVICDYLIRSDKWHETKALLDSIPQSFHGFEFNLRSLSFLREKFGRVPIASHKLDRLVGRASITSLLWYGRFGHTLAEYLKLQYICDELKISLEVPEHWIGREIFLLDNPLIDRTRPRYARSMHSVDSAADLEKSIEGYDIFSPGGWNWKSITSGQREFARGKLRIRDCINNILQIFFADLLKRDFLSVHIRLTDVAEPDFYLSRIKDIRSTFGDSLIYLASDDLDRAKDLCAGMNILTAENFSDSTLPPWLIDFYALTVSTMAAVPSSSSFSNVALLINPRISPRDVLFFE